jgi:hypothetical protein
VWMEWILILCLLQIPDVGFFIFIFGGIGAWPQGLELARQAL